MERLSTRGSVDAIIGLEYLPTGSANAQEFGAAFPQARGTNSGSSLRAYAATTALLAAMLFSGTGGHAVHDADTFVASRTTAQAVVQEHSRRKRKASAVPIPLSERVKAIQRSFSLNVGQLSAALGVGRPAVYRWLRDGAKPHNANLARLEILYRLAQDWTRSSPKPVGKYLIVPLWNGESLASLLSRSEVNIPEVQEAMSAIAGAINAAEQRKRRSAYRSVADVMAENRYEAEREDVQRTNLEDMLGT